MGKRIRQRPENTWREIGRVTGNVHDDGVNEDAKPTIYWPLMLRDYWDQELYARSTLA